MSTETFLLIALHQHRLIVIMGIGLIDGAAAAAGKSSG